ncbi:MAG: hypothetical protein ACLS7Z_03645 [Christensenellales bacterium]
MKQLMNMQIIGIDHGYGNLKTASGIFPASILTFDHEPAYAQDLLIYDGKYHVIGSGHREFTPDKVSDPDHYILTRFALQSVSPATARRPWVLYAQDQASRGARHRLFLQCAATRC